MIEAALKYHKAGFRVIPVKEDKRPLCLKSTGYSWKCYVEYQSEQDVKDLFSQQGVYGIAVLTGVDGLEVIDIDCKYDVKGRLMARYFESIDTFGNVDISNLVRQATQNNGFHFFYKSENIEGNLKLARRPSTTEELDKYNLETEKYNEKVVESNKNLKKGEKPKVLRKKITDPARRPKVLIETRGIGGYVLVAPSKGYDFDNLDLFSLSILSREERRTLLNAGRALNDLKEPTELSREERDGQKYIKKNIVKGETAWDAYNKSDDVLDLLQSHGWTRQTFKQTSDRIYFTRPDKKFGNSGDFHTGLRLFKSWSTSTQFEDGKAYSPFAVFATLEHAGDFSQAAKELYRLGFGDRIEREKSAPPSQAEKLDLQELLAGVRKFDINNPPKEIESIWNLDVEKNSYKIAGRGMIVAVVGKAKSRKTTLIACAIASAIDGGHSKLGFRFNMEGKDIIFIDTEQPEYWFHKTHERICRIAGLMHNPDNYHAYSLRKYTVDERVALIDKILSIHKNVGCVVLDGIVDICNDFNSVDESQKTIQHLMTWSEKTKAIFIPVLHLTKGLGYMKGHLGSLLGNKCDGTIEVEYDSGSMLSNVKSRLSRFAPFTKFSFGQTEDGTPFLDGSKFDVLGRNIHNEAERDIDTSKEDDWISKIPKSGNPPF